MESESKFNPLEQAIEVFMLTASLDNPSRVVLKFPFIIDANFEIVWQNIMEQVPSEYKSHFERSLGWLRQIANEQKKREEKDQ
jgi:hypothetical protein